MTDKIMDETDRAATPPMPVKEQPDPLLESSPGQASIGEITLFALVAAVILGVVLYGLNAPNDVASTSAPPGSVAQSSSPAAGGGSSAPAPHAGNNAKG